MSFAAPLSEIFQKQGNLVKAKQFLDISLNAAHIAGGNKDYFTAYNAASSYYRAAKDNGRFLVISVFIINR